MFNSLLKNPSFRRTVRGLSYRTPRARWLYRLCKLYVDNYDGDNNTEMEVNGEVKFLRQALRHIGSEPVIFDVGANRGDWCQAVLEIQPRARIHCFEPSKRAWTLLKSRGFSPNVICNAAGMGERQETLTLHVDPDVLELSSIYGGNKGTGGEPQQVPILTVDSYSQEHGIGQIDYLKIDVEGHELAVLKGAREMLAQKRIRFVQFEYGSWYIEARIYLKDVFEWLKDFDYDIGKVMPYGFRKIGAYRPALEGFENANYLLIRRDGPGGSPLRQAEFLGS